MPKAPTIKEKQVLIDCKSVLEPLKRAGLLDYWRITVGGILQRGKFMVPNKEMAGFSDIIILIPDQVDIFLELKSEVGCQSDNQKEFERRVLMMGRKYCLCKSREELCKILSENGICRKLIKLFSGW